MVFRIILFDANNQLDPTGFIHSLPLLHLRIFKMPNAQFGCYSMSERRSVGHNAPTTSYNINIEVPPIEV